MEFIYYQILVCIIIGTMMLIALALGLYYSSVSDRTRLLRDCTKVIIDEKNGITTCINN